MAEWPGIYNTGTATVAANGTTVTFQSAGNIAQALRPGDRFGAHKGLGIRISAISGTTATLAQPWPGAAQTAAAYEIALTPYDSGYRQALQRLLDAFGASGNVLALAGLEGVADNLPIFTGAGTMGLIPLDEISPISSVNGHIGEVELTAGDVGAYSKDEANERYSTVVATRAVLASLNPSLVSAAYLKEAGREGMFMWRVGNFNAQVTADTQEGVYIKAASLAASVGAWVRVHKNVLNVMWFGAKGDGVTDDAPAIVGAYKALPETGGTIYFPPAPSGFYATTQPLTFGNGTTTSVSTKQNVYLVGAETQGSADQIQAPAFNRAASRIVYTGSAQASHVVKFAGPMSCAMVGISVDANLKADVGLLAEHCFRSAFSDLFIYRAIKGIRSYASCQNHSLVSCGDADNTWTRVHTSNIIQDGTTGIDLGNDSMPGNLCSSRNVFQSCAFLVSDHANSTSRTIRGADNNQFSNCMFYVHGDRKGTNTAILAPSDALFKHLPYENLDENCAYMGKWYFDPTWDVDNLNSHVNSFFPLNSGDLLDPTKANVGSLPDRKGMWGFDSRGYFFGRPVLEGFFNGQMSSVPAVIYKRRSQITVQNTTAETNIAAKVIRGQTLRARRSGAYSSPTTWFYDRQLRIRASGYYLNSSGGNVNLTLKAIFGGTVAFETTVLVASAAGERAWSFEGEISALDDGTLQEMMGRFDLGVTGTAGSVAGDVAHSKVQRRRDIAENLATDRNLFISAAHGTASASVFLVCRVATVELL